jgi:hypothetical protein
MTFFRIQDANRDAADLLDPGYQFSTPYNRNTRATRRGVSTCASLEDLAEYLASGLGEAIAAPLRTSTNGWVIVEIDGAVSPDAPLDPCETLVIPIRIVSVRPVDDRFMALVAAADEYLARLAGGPEFDFDPED